MSSYYCPVCDTNRFAPVCPVCLEQSTGVQLESFVVHVTFYIKWESDLYEITPIGKNGINIEPVEPIMVNRVLYNMHSYVNRNDDGSLSVSDNNAYMSKANSIRGWSEVTPAAKAKGIDLSLAIAEFIYSGAFDDLLNASEIIEVTRKYEKAEEKYIETLEAVLQYQREKNAYMESLVSLGANLRATIQ